jgi:hypothetical protein
MVELSKMKNQSKEQRNESFYDPMGSTYCRLSSRRTKATKRQDVRCPGQHTTEGQTIRLGKLLEKGILCQTNQKGKTGQKMSKVKITIESSDTDFLCSLWKFLDQYVMVEPESTLVTLHETSDALKTARELMEIMSTRK